MMFGMFVGLLVILKNIYKYHQILQGRALTSGKMLCEIWFINTFPICVNCELKEDVKNKFSAHGICLLIS